MRPGVPQVIRLTETGPHGTLPNGRALETFD
jgi:hypothetical protein